jgi:hypothetical protein
MKPIRNPQPTLFDLTDHEEQYVPRPAELFRPQRVILAKGSVSTAKRPSLAERICAAYSTAEVVEQLGTAHNTIDLGISDPLQLHYEGRRTLVLGEHNSAVGRSDEEGDTCPNFWHFSPYGYCPYGCSYCYLAGTQGVRFSPTVKVFMNLDEILARVDKQARKIGRAEAFYLGKLKDGMALDPLTGYSRVSDIHGYAAPLGKNHLLLPYDAEGHALTEQALSARFPFTHRYLLKRREGIPVRGKGHRPFYVLRNDSILRRPSAPRILAGMVTSGEDVTITDMDTPVPHAGVLVLDNLPAALDPHDLLAVLNGPAFWSFVRGAMPTMGEGRHVLRRGPLAEFRVPLPWVFLHGSSWMARIVSDNWSRRWAVSLSGRVRQVSYPARDTPITRHRTVTGNSLRRPSIQAKSTSSRLRRTPSRFQDVTLHLKTFDIGPESAEFVLLRGEASDTGEGVGPPFAD